MALRKIREQGDEILTKKCREVKEMTPRLRELVADMLDTMYEAEGVGLAAPQVGVLKRIVVIDIGAGPIVLVNPRITHQDGEQEGNEGCLSVPGKAGVVVRPNHVIVEAFNEEMNITFLFVTHSTKVAADFCTRGVVMKKGKKVFDGDIHEAIAFYDDMISKEDAARRKKKK